MGRDLKRSLVKARPTPKQGQGAHMGLCTDACTCTLSRLSEARPEYVIKGESISDCFKLEITSALKSWGGYQLLINQLLGATVAKCATQISVNPFFPYGRAPVSNAM